MKDKNGVELKIGDTVHYYRVGRTLGNGTNVSTRDITFVINEFIPNPLPDKKFGKMWVTGDDFITHGFKNSVSPLAVVKVGVMVKKYIRKFVFN